MSQSSSVPPPTPSNFVPPSEGGGQVGSDSAMFARADHQHPRLTSATPVTLDANGEGTVTFSRTFSSPPMPAFTRVPPISGGPCVFEVYEWIPSSGSPVTGAKVRGYRLSGPQNLAAVTVLGISVAVGGQTLVSYGPANGVTVSVIALQAS